MKLLAQLKQALFRWQSDGTAPLRLGQRRIFIIPSRGGLLFVSALVVMLIGAINYSLALGHALVFLLAGLGLVGMIHTFRNLYDLVITPGRCDAVFAGEIAYFELRLDNERATARRALTFEADAEHPVTVTVDAGKMLKIAIPQRTIRRGWCELSRIRLSSEYPLGLFHAWSYLQPAMRCLVFPTPVMTPLPAPSATNHQGTQRGAAGQEDFSGFRLRQPTDSLHHVAWKASARIPDSNDLLVKQFAGGSALELQLDWALTDPALPDETRLGILCGWVLQADASGQRYGLRLPGHEIAPADTKNQRLACLQLLALFTL